MAVQKKREIDAQAFDRILQRLAEISASAFSLQYDLKPLSAEEIEAGAEPLTQDQIQEPLEEIQNTISILVLTDLGASAEEWYAANDRIQ